MAVALVRWGNIWLGIAFLRNTGLGPRNVFAGKQNCRACLLRWRREPKLRHLFVFSPYAKKTFFSRLNALCQGVFGHIHAYQVYRMFWPPARNIPSCSCCNIATDAGATDAGALRTVLSSSISVAASYTTRTYSISYCCMFCGILVDLLSTYYRKQHASARKEEEVALQPLLPS